MFFFEQIKNKEDLEKEIDKRIKELCDDSKPIEIKSYLELNDYSFVHKGFINLDSKVKCSSDCNMSYSLNEVDYFYLFANILYDFDNVNKYEIVNLISEFVNKYFGSNKYKYDNRVEELYRSAWDSSFDEEEYTNKINHLTIGDFKNSGAATSVEKSIMANNLLSFYGIESYFCIGLIRNKDEIDYHTFNIINCNQKFLIIDVSNSYINNKGIHSPFRGLITMDEVEEMLDSDLIKGFIIKDNKTEYERKYKIGNIKIKRRKY